MFVFPLSTYFYRTYTPSNGDLTERGQRECHSGVDRKRRHKRERGKAPCIAAQSASRCSVFYLAMNNAFKGIQEITESTVPTNVTICALTLAMSPMRCLVTVYPSAQLTGLIALFSVSMY